MQSDNSHVQKANAALEPLRVALAVDGYGLQVQSSPRGVKIEVVELPEACKECLMDEGLFRVMVTQALDDAGLASMSQTYDLIYPPVEDQA